MAYRGKIVYSEPQEGYMKIIDKDEFEGAIIIDDLEEKMNEIIKNITD